MRAVVPVGLTFGSGDVDAPVMCSVHDSVGPRQRPAIGKGCAVSDQENPDEPLTWEQALVRQRLAAFPLAGRLATVLEHPEWVTGADLLTPSTSEQYVEAIESCRSRGLPVEEHERVHDVRRLRGVDANDDEDLTEVTTYELSATVAFEGQPVTIAGGMRERRVVV
jgi:hypothetical protein